MKIQLTIVKDFAVSEIVRNFAEPFGRKAGDDRTLKRLTIDKSSTGAQCSGQGTLNDQRTIKAPGEDGSVATTTFFWKKENKINNNGEFDPGSG